MTDMEIRNRKVFLLQNQLADFNQILSSKKCTIYKRGYNKYTMNLRKFPLNQCIEKDNFAQDCLLLRASAQVSDVAHEPLVMDIRDQQKRF